MCIHVYTYRILVILFATFSLSNPHNFSNKLLTGSETIVCIVTIIKPLLQKPTETKHYEIPQGRL